MVLLLSDGILEPNPRDDAYAPLNYAYMAAVARHFGDPHQELYRTDFLPRLAPMASRMIATRLVPALKEMGAEVFTVALGPTADRSFLRELAAQTSLSPTESHSFAATVATDLIPIFAKTIGYFTDLAIFRTVDGEIGPSQTSSITVDGFISAPQIISVVEGTGQMVVRSENGREELAEPGLHPALRLYRLAGAELPAAWTFGFQSGSGRFRTLVVGHNRLVLVPEGLKDQYAFDEPVRLRTLVRIAGSSETPQLGAESRVTVGVEVAGTPGQVMERTLTFGDGAFETLWKPEQPESIS